MGYIEKFKNIEQIKECAKYYIELLGLQDWRIVFKLTDNLNSEYAGQCERIYTSKVACISIKKSCDENNSEVWFKQPQEETLIHELLHCKFMQYDVNSIEGVLFDEHNHQLLDDMARAIFKARYNFTNDDYYFEEE